MLADRFTVGAMHGYTGDPSSGRILPMSNYRLEALMSYPFSRALARAATLSLWSLLAVLPAAAQNGKTPEEFTKEAWLTPPANIAEEVLAPRHLNVSLSNPSPNRKFFLQQQSEGMPSMAAFAKPHVFLGGLQVDLKANRVRSLTTRGAAGLAVISAETGRTVEIAPPAGATISNAQWSPDGTQVAFFANFDDATHIYIADAATGRSRRLTKTPVLATLMSSFEWTGDGKTIMVMMIPDNRGAMPVKPAVPTEPMVRFSEGVKNPNRTFASLLETPYDMALLEYFATGQLVAIDAKSGAVRKIGRPAMVQSVDASPDGKYVRVTTTTKPFSYIVPVNNFGGTEEIWSVDGALNVQLSARELRDGTPEDSAARNRAQVEKRDLAWAPDGNGLIYLQQEPAPRRTEAQADQPQEEGNRSQQARRKDRVYRWLPPFDANSAKPIYESDARITSAVFSDDMQTLFVAEGPGGIGGGGGRFGGGGGRGGQADNQQTHVYAVKLSEPTRRYTIARFRGEDFYNNPGALMTKRGPLGGNVVQTTTDDRYVFLQGTRYSRDPKNEAPRPFIDKVEITTGQKQRIFESAADMFEQPVELLDDDATRMIITRENQTTVPDSYLRAANGQLTKLTNNKDYNPNISRAQRRIIDITRPDGMKFQARVTLPHDYRPGEKRPAMFWFYPREYETQEAYDRGNRTLNKNRFPTVGTRSMDVLIKLGYIVVEPDAPIFGESGRMNDNYVHDLRMNLTAVIDELDERQGLIDRSRLGLGGHSYGAFSTVNAMVHTPFFKAGIAGDGNYNRTLTPNSFQSERRDLWEAREVYLGMSPFLYANNLTGALLMYHGMADQNVGTHPINATRLFHALDGLGKTVSLYMYPYEDHGPATRETTLDLWARWSAWLDHYVKNANKTQPKVTTDGSN